ncbi:MAG: protein kinase [Saprospiraceae bacterium]|nr:protein kinase [Saprospiraceae bacterium]MCF8251039.1 protein kinase [Saprospiraceae bacterium]MCF8281495.1 protein kinase [Bacteroidales bacterium]MCF8311636.1 protein kinase [Saprospiraceae bacterium]MCF8440977.1 protein kinase [Saprospiraceae bacterium]
MIKELVQDGKIEEALDALLKLLESMEADANTLALLRSRLAQLEEKRLKKVAKQEDLDTEMNRITDSFLYFYENLEERVNTVLDLKYDVNDFDKQVQLKMMRHFDIQEVLGSGTSAVIYRARELSSGKTVAVRALKDIKPLPNTLSSIVYRLKHRNIIEVLSSYESDIPFCLVLEYINGITLDKLLEVGYIPRRDTISIIRQLCDGLYYLQNLGVDLKNLRPSKIIIDHELKPVISVFEIFKDMRGFSRLDKIKDDLIYSSPEELSVEAENIDYDKVNQFLMGLLMYEMMTGCPLFRGNTVEEVMDHRRQFFSKPVFRRGVLKAANLPKKLQDILDRLLQEDPNKRYSNLVELDKELYRLPIHGERSTELVHESYLRCCAKSKDFISSFYVRLFQEHPERDYAKRFGEGPVSKRTRKKLRVMLLQLIDVDNPNALANFALIKQYSGHAGLEMQDFSNFLQTLKAEMQENDFYWKRDPAIGKAWDDVIQQALDKL